MSTEIDIFENNPLANIDKFKEMQEVNKKLVGNSFPTGRRISIKGGKFREIVNGEQMKVSKSDTLNVVIIDCAPISRTYYAGDYDPDTVTAPVCWSADTDNPDSDVKEAQASRCADCPQNVKGSGQGKSRACRFSQRLAVAIENDLDTVYQLSLPATSLFGDAKENAMPMQGYARYLDDKKVPAIAVVTEMRFDDDAEVPKLFFRPVRILEEEELNQAAALMETEACKNAIEFKVFETDKVEENAEEEEKPPAKQPAKKKTAKVTKLEPKTLEGDLVDDEEDEEEIKEPTKVVKKNEPEPDDEKQKLAGLISGWDD